MGALATSKSTHISMVVPMTGYVLCSIFCYYILFDERRGSSPDPLEKDERQSDVAEEIKRPPSQVTDKEEYHESGIEMNGAAGNK